MDSQKIRIVLSCCIGILVGILLNMWQTEHPPVIADPKMLVATDLMPNLDIPLVPSPISAASLAGTPPIPVIGPDRLIEVNTDVYTLLIDKKGGNIIKAQLKKYPQKMDTPLDGYHLLDYTKERYYVAQSGLINAKGPDNQRDQAIYTSAQAVYNLGSDQKQLKVDLQWVNEDGIAITKSFVFEPNSYVINVNYTINNTTNTEWQAKLYGQLKREYKGATSSGMFGVQMYQGSALYTPDKPYKKISFEKMSEEVFSQNIKGGWAALLEHYFLSAWLPDQSKNNQYYTRAYDHNQYAIGTLTDISVPAQKQAQIGGRFYIGPELTDVLKTLHAGLDLTVDYGILWPISQVIFTLMKYIHHFIGNWGAAIILVTLFIKIVFYKLSATSYRSLGNMRRVQPKLDAIKLRYADDKQKQTQATIDLYRKEKVNPFGGCLPVIVQIPVFIALYYVLLASVELRQAPFILWIHDLASKDPYYVLPIITGATMFLQQKFNPTPIADPMQAKMMLFMPVIFTCLFLSFPAGLVLYWVVNNILTMAQQALIMHGMEKTNLKNKDLIRKT